MLRQGSRVAAWGGTGRLGGRQTWGQADLGAGAGRHLQDLGEGHVACSHLAPTKPVQQNIVKHNQVAASAEVGA